MTLLLLSAAIDSSPEIVVYGGPHDRLNTSENGSRSGNCRALTARPARGATSRLQQSELSYIAACKSGLELAADEFNCDRTSES